MVWLIWFVVFYGIIWDLMCLFVMKFFVGGGVLELEKVDCFVFWFVLMLFLILVFFKDVEVISLVLVVWIGGFVCVDYMIDVIIFCIYVMVCWVIIMER